MLAPLDPNQAGFGFSPKPQYSTGDTPLWENPIFADVVLGRSLDDGKRGLPPPPKLTPEQQKADVAVTVKNAFDDKVGIDKASVDQSGLPVPVGYVMVNHKGGKKTKPSQSYQWRPCSLARPRLCKCRPS
jgi:hypothetical protein